MGYWPNNTPAALSLTFDDAVPSQLDVAIAMLERLRVKATFYVSPAPLQLRAPEWQRVHRLSHEIGNHTVAHPCSGNFGFIGENALEEYTLDRIAVDIEDANHIIEECIGAKPKTFAYPCGQKFVGRGREVRSYVPLVAERFLAGRGYLDESHNIPGRCDLAQLFAYGIDGIPFSQIANQIERCVQDGGWLIYGMHGIDSGHSLFTDSKVLEATIELAVDLGFWVDTVERIATHLSANEPILEAKSEVEDVPSR